MTLQPGPAGQSPVPLGHPLRGVYEKLARAQQHQEDLTRRLDAVLGPDKQTFWMEPDPVVGGHALRVRGVPDIDPAWQCVIGDCLFNLRSALDYLAWQLVILDGEEPTGDTYFPVRASPQPRSLIRPVLGRSDILNAVDEVQPYRLGDGTPATARRSPLWMVHELNRIDKHRLPLVLVTIPSPGQMWWGWSGNGEPPDFRINWSKMANGSAVGWFDFHGGSPPPDFNPHPALQVTFNEPSLPHLTGVPLVNVLQMMIMWVADDIVDYRFRPLFD